MEVKVIFPWVLILVGIALTVGMIGGWFLHADAMGQAKANLITEIPAQLKESK